MFNKIKYYLSKDGIDELATKEHFSTEDSRRKLRDGEGFLPKIARPKPFSFIILYAVGIVGCALLYGSVVGTQIFDSRMIGSGIFCAIWIAWMYDQHFKK